ncbi:MAG: dUTP diphosphatase [Kiritimatiellia bacterium]
MSLKVAFRKLHPAAVLPSYAHEGDAGMDLSSVEEVTVPPHGRALVATGLAIELPLGTEAQVRPRSGLAAKYGITVLNAPGTIDAGYRGEIKVILLNTDVAEFRIEPGMRIAQLVVAPVAQVQVSWTEQLGESDRGTSGFGSSGI